MATHELEILGRNAKPDTSGNVFKQPYSVIDTATVIDPYVWCFKDSGTVVAIDDKFLVPRNYVGTAKINFYWCANATTNSAQFDFDYLARSSGEDMGAAVTEAVTVAQALSGAAFDLYKTTVSLTSGNLAAGDIVTFKLARDSATDTLATTLMLFSATFEYSDA